MTNNYLEYVPVREPELHWEQDEAGFVTLYVHNTGVLKKLTQIILKKPEYSQVHLDEQGSYVWQMIDGERDLIELGELIQERLGEKAEPLYPRLVKYIQILESYHFITLKKNV